MKVKYGVAVILWYDTKNRRDTKFLLMKRKGSHGAGTWSVPGGHIEPGENPKDTCVREVKEETGLDISGYNLHSLSFHHDVFEELDGQEYVTLWYMCNIGKKVKVEIKEPEKCESMKFVSTDGWYHNRKLFQCLSTFFRREGRLPI